MVFSACDNKGIISFCEDINKEGDAINCGNKFTNGDVNFVINAKKIFGQKEIKIKIYNKNVSLVKPEIIETRKVDPNQKKLNTTVKIVNEGSYRVEINANESEVLAEGELEVIDDI
jgi:hypothetical protein